MKKYCLLTLFSCITSLTWAGSQEKKAFALLDSISRHKNLQASFSYHIQQDQEPSEEKLTGSITVQGPQYHLSMGGQEIISNGTTVWNYLPDANEVQINDYAPEQGANTPWFLLTNYRKDYQFTSLHSQQIEGRNHYTVALTAKDIENNMQVVVITIEQKTKKVKRLESLDNDQNRHTYSITDFVTNVALEDTFFYFVPEDHIDIEVIDMR